MKDELKPNIRQALPRDTDCIIAILREAAKWLEKSGSPMWRDNELLPSQLAADVNAGLVFIAECDGEPAGVVKFQLEDRLFWSDMPQREAAYVHRLAVKRAFADGQVSSALLGWAVERARLLGKQFIRLDCEASRTRLRAVYERFGFQHHSDREVGPYFVSRYEYRVQSEPGNFNQFGLAPGELRFVTVGPEWAKRFEREHRRIAETIGASALDIQHVGSTSVPGIIAKPVLDIAMAIQDFESGYAQVQPIVTLGYTYRGENGIPRRHYFELGWAVHLHVFEHGGAEWKRHLRFRDRLRASPELATRYSEVKRAAAKEAEGSISRYQELKSPFIRESQRS